MRRPRIRKSLAGVHPGSQHSDHELEKMGREVSSSYVAEGYTGTRAQRDTGRMHRKKRGSKQTTRSVQVSIRGRLRDNFVEVSDFFARPEQDELGIARDLCAQDGRRLRMLRPKKTKQR